MPPSRGRRATVASDEDLQRAQNSAAAAETGGEPAAQARASAIRDSLTAALTTLPAEQRACWGLHNLHQLSYQEIAYAIGRPARSLPVGGTRRGWKESTRLRALIAEHAPPVWSL